MSYSTKELRQRHALGLAPRLSELALAFRRWRRSNRLTLLQAAALCPAMSEDTLHRFEMGYTRGTLDTHAQLKNLMVRWEGQRPGGRAAWQWTPERRARLRAKHAARRATA